MTRKVQAETETLAGARVVLFEDTWREHILDPAVGHPEMEPHCDALLAAISRPDYREADERPARERFYKHNVGPSAWLTVVVSFEQVPARVVTAFAIGSSRAPGR